MGSSDSGMPYRTICQIVDADGKPAQAIHTSNLWELDGGVFSQKSEGNSIEPFTTGADYFADFIAKCDAAASEICILGWQVNWDALLKEGVRLYDVLKRAAERGVSIYVMPWCHSNPVQTYDYQTATVLGHINDGLPEKRVHVVRANSRATVNVRYFSHHQKQVIIDRKLAYVGGIDLCYGRYDDASYDLHADLAGRQVMNRYNPCIPPQLGIPATSKELADPDRMSGFADGYTRSTASAPTNREAEQRKIDQGAWQVPYREAGTADAVLNKPSVDSNTPDPFTLDPSFQPRMPWQDVHCRIEGPAVSDLLRNFVVRWNSSGGKTLKFPPLPTEYEKKGVAHIQVLRSAPAGMVAAEAKVPSNPRKTASGTEDHIQKTMIRLIEKASSFIYIESQFFVSGFGELVPEPNGDLSPAAQFINNYYGSDQNSSARMAGTFNDNKKWFVPDKKDLMAPPENGVCQALVGRLRRAIIEGRTPFHVYITLPVHPEGALAKASIAVQVYWTMQTIAHGSHSLLNGIRRAFKAKELLEAKTAGSYDAAVAMADKIPVEELDQDDESWKDYVTLLNLRNWAKLGDRYVTEQIYIHSKLMIVDDLYALLGSANINDRSLLGERDSEIAVLVMDGESTLAEICTPGRKRPVRLFAHKLRKDIWRKIFGIAGGIRPANHLQAAIDAPANPQSWKAIQAQAEKNAAAYEAVFPFVPRSWVVNSKGAKNTAKIIPNWDDQIDNPRNSKTKGFPTSRLPFENEFWNVPQHNSAKAAQLETIKGFITALPTHWLQGENVRFEFPTDLVVKNEAPQRPELKTEIQIGEAETLGKKA